ncbi:hypothetical protein BH23BAC4_BH23BAC4_05340 [soil metagenome]
MWLSPLPHLMIALLTDTVSADLGRSLRYLLLWGLDGVVLRVVGGESRRVPHVNEAQVRHRLAEDELPLMAVDPGILMGAVEERADWLNDLTSLPESVAFCKRHACRRIIAECLPESADPNAAVIALRRAADEVEKDAIVLCVRPTGWASAPSGLDLLHSAASGSAMRLLWDPAAYVEAGGRLSDAPISCITPHIEMVVVRDVDESGGMVDVVPGDGRLKWDRHIHDLTLSGFDGPWVLEVRSERPAKQGLKHADALIRMIKDAKRAV